MDGDAANHDDVRHQINGLDSPLELGLVAVSLFSLIRSVRRCPRSDGVVDVGVAAGSRCADRPTVDGAAGEGEVEADPLPHAAVASNPAASNAPITILIME